MAKKFEPITITGFSGLNTVDPVGAIPDDALAVATNVDITDSRTLAKRRGFARWSNTQPNGGLASIRMLGRHRTATADKLYFCTSGRLWRANTTDMSSVEEITLSAASVTNCQWGFQHAGNFQVVRSGGGTNIGVTMASTAAINGTGPSATHAVAHKNRMFSFNTLDTGGTLEYRLHYSAINNLSSWNTSTDFIDVNPGDGAPIVALVVLSDTLYIFKSDSTWALTADGSPSSWVLRNVNQGIGCVGRGTVQIIDGMIYFLARQGVYRTDGVTFEELSGPIRNQFTNRVYSTRQSLLDADSAYFDNKYIVSLDGGQTQWVYHISVGGWTRWIVGGSISPRGFCNVSEYSPDYLYTGCGVTGYLYRMGATAAVWQDDTTNYTVDVRTKEFTFNNPTSFKRLHYTELDFDPFTSTSLTVTLRHNFDGNVTNTHSVTSVFTTRNMLRFPGVGYFRYLQERIEMSANSDFELLGINMMVEARGRNSYAH